MTTRVAARLEPSRSQAITIIRGPGITNADPNCSNPASYIVTRDVLWLEFDLLFLRRPGCDWHPGIAMQMYTVKAWEDGVYM